MSYHDPLPDDPIEYLDEWDLYTSAELAERDLRVLLDEVKLDDYGRRILTTYFAADGDELLG